jgi:multisubunit Na+/H+ antiporter MnhC subunit
MRAEDLALVQGMDHTRAALADWNRQPGIVLRAWSLGAGAIAVGLLLAVWLIASVVTADPTPVSLPGLTAPAHASDALHVLGRNLLVLALHSFACVAGFIAGSSLPVVAQQHSGLWRRVHDHAGPLAIAFVIGATTFSLCTQAYVLGHGAATLSAQLGVSNGILLLGLLPHALPELFALFLPLAAWIIASRHDDWHELLAATLVTTAIALPMLVAAAFIEVFASPHLIRALAG